MEYKQCNACESETIISVSAKSSDLNVIQFEDIVLDGSVPFDIGIDGGDYVEFSYCFICGVIQNWKPLDSNVVREIFKTEQKRYED